MGFQSRHIWLFHNFARTCHISPKFAQQSKQSDDSSTCSSPALVLSGPGFPSTFDIDQFPELVEGGLKTLGFQKMFPKITLWISKMEQKSWAWSCFFCFFRHGTYYITWFLLVISWSQAGETVSIAWNPSFSSGHPCPGAHFSSLHIDILPDMIWYDYIYI